MWENAPLTPCGTATDTQMISKVPTNSSEYFGNHNISGVIGMEMRCIVYHCKVCSFCFTMTLFVAIASCRAEIIVVLWWFGQEE